MSLSIADLLTPQTVDQVRETFVSALELLGVRARSWRKGGAASTILRVVAISYSGMTQLATDFIASGFLETSTGPWLTLLARYVYGVERVEAARASGFVTFTNTGGGIFDFGPGEVSITNPATGKAYTNVEPLVLNPGDIKTIAIASVEFGSGSSTGPGTITKLETSMVGVTATNAAAVVGTDAQSDPDLRQTCANKLASLSPNGPRGAYAYAIRTAKRADGTAVDVNRWQISRSSSTGRVDIWIASPAGVPLDVDVEAVQANVLAIAEPDTVTATVFPCTVAALSQTITVWATKVDGLLPSDLKTRVANALVAAIATYALGGIAKPPSTQGFLFGSFIEGTCKAAHPSIFAVDGATDIALAVGQVAELTAAITVRTVGVTQ